MEKDYDGTLMTNHGADTPEAPPKKNKYPAVWDLVLEDMRKRKEMGFKKYGTYLQPFNGRSALWDAYQESLDKVVYLRQAIFEEENPETVKPKIKTRAVFQSWEFWLAVSIIVILNLATILVR